MPSKRRQPEEIIEDKVFTTVDEVDQAITKLSRRLEEVRALDPQRIHYDDPAVRSAAENFSDAVLAIYGLNSPEYRRFRYHRIRHGSEYIGMGERDRQKAFADGLTHTAAAIENLIKQLQERRDDFDGDASSRVRSAFASLDLHPRIGAACAELYRDGHYRNAVLDASLALVNMVREKSRKHDLDGAPLMTTVFSKNKPVLAFNDLRDRTEEDEQEGMMHLFVGAILGLRNPRAHALLDDSPEMALEYIGLISLLAKRVDQSARATS